MITPVTTWKKMTGEIIGTVTCQKIRHRLAPSTSAASFLLLSKPVDIPAGSLARWPVALDVNGVRVDWATASVLTLLPGPVPTARALRRQLLAVDAVHVEARRIWRSPPPRSRPAISCPT